MKHRLAVDFGCGVDRLSSALAHRFNEVIGIEASETMVTIARGSCLTHVRTLSTVTSHFNIYGRHSPKATSVSSFELHPGGHPSW